MKKLSIFIIAILLFFCVSCAENEQELGGQTLADGIINGSIEMSDEDKATLRNIFNSGKFESDVGNCDTDVKVQIVGRALTYHSECGNFNDAKKVEHFKLSDAQREVVNALLSKYVSLGEESPERTVVDIIDTTRDLEIDLPDVEQVFFEDENYKYIFGMPIAEYVVVKFSDGTSKQLCDALSSGEVEITDLDKYGMSYYKEAKEKSHTRTVVNIVNTVKDDMALPDVEEVFYEDYLYRYSFGNPISDYVIVEFSDGSTMPIREALESGKILIAHLDKYGIPYYKEQIGIETKA